MSWRDDMDPIRKANQDFADLRRRMEEEILRETEPRKPKEQDPTVWASYSPPPRNLATAAIILTICLVVRAFFFPLFGS